MTLAPAPRQRRHDQPRLLAVASWPRLESVFRTDRSANVMRELVPRYFPKARTALDMTAGKLRFWKWAHTLQLTLIDLEPQVPEVQQMDARHTSFPDASFDLVVVDPPFMHGTRGRGSRRDTYAGSIRSMNADYAHLPTQTAVIQLYRDLLNEARRLCTMGAIVKCKDMVEHGDLIESSYYVRQALEFYSFRVVEKALMEPPHHLPTDPEDAVHHLRRKESYFYVATPIRRPG